MVTPGRQATAGPDARAGHDTATVLAIALLAYVIAKLAHEGVGHALVCELVGGELRGFSSSWSDCDKDPVTEWGDRAIKAGGTLCNLAVGAACLVLSRRTRSRSGTLRYFLWMTAAVNLFIGGGYLMMDPLFGFGDWGRFIEGLSPRWAWRVGLAAAGIAISLGTFFVLRPSFETLLGDETRGRRPQARLLCWLPYLFVGGVVMTGAALLNSLGPRYALTSALATLGGTFLLVWLPVAVEPQAKRPDLARFTVERSRGWLIAGAVTLAFLLGAFGPGISF